MRTAIDLLYLALGVSSVEKMDAIPFGQPTCFQAFDITLPIQEFRGLQPKWTVLVLDPEALQDKSWAPARITAEASVILPRLSRRRPVLTISDAKAIRLGDEFERGPGDVFSVDAPNLPGKSEAQSESRFSPFVLALRRKGLASLFAPEHFTPYLKGRPAQGWQFYGRKKELHTLVHSDDNYMIIGSRRVGKTSLMQEAERCLRARGENVIHINVQHRATSHEVAGDILRALSPRDMHYAIRHGDALGERPLAMALKKLTMARRRTTLLIDELGNIILNRPKDDWNFIGLLRNYAQMGHLRVIASCFQEVLIKQQEESEGPLVNFANTLRLTVFTESEVDESFLSPFEFWLNLQPSERRELRGLVASEVGFHPYFLQYFCWHLFAQMSKQNGGSLMENANKLVRAGIIDCFASPQDEVFYHRGASALIHYVFLSRCKEVDETGRDRLINSLIDDDWLEKFLLREGFSSTVASRRNLLEGLELRGLSAPLDGARGRQRIASPVVYFYVKRAERPIEKYLEKLKHDVRTEAAWWGLGDELSNAPL